MSLKVYVGIVRFLVLYVPKRMVVTSNVVADRAVAGTVNEIALAYLNSPPFKMATSETQRTRRNIIENFTKVNGQLPLYRSVGGTRIMLLTREHMQRIVNSKAATPFAQRNFLNTMRAMFRWALREG